MVCACETEFAKIAAGELMVSSGSPVDDKEMVRQAVDIVDLVGSHVQLRRQGRNYVAHCPWHDDSRPSLQVNPERQSWRCWVCDIGGDVFSFVMQIEGVEFREALEMLAERAGIELRRFRPAHFAPSQGAAGQDAPEASPPPVSGKGKQKLFKAMQWAESQYHKCLLESPDGEIARKYLAERRITRESIERFYIGLSPNRHDWLLEQVGRDPNRAKILETVGILARSQEGGKLYDRFRGRLLFSIRDTQGRPVAFGGRVLPESGTTSRAKYVNSNETPLFHKSNLLYGLDVAKEALRKQRQKEKFATALVMEGYTDVVVAHQYGFGNAVAVMGTALGEGHIKVLKRFADRIVLILDGDEAGQSRTTQVLGLFVAEQVDLQILTLPEGSDPCDFLHEHGPEAFAEMVQNNAVEALDHAFEAKTRGVDLERDVHRASQALEELVEIVARAPRLRQDTTREDRFREEKILQRLSAWFRVDEAEVRQRLTALRRQQRNRRPSPRPESARPEVPPPPTEEDGLTAPDDFDPQAYDAEQFASQPLGPAQQELLEILVQHPQCLAEVRSEIEPQWIPPGPAKEIYDTICRLADDGETPDFDRLMLSFDRPATKSLLVELDEQRRGKQDPEHDPAALARELVETIQQQEAQRRRPGQLVTLREGGLDDDRATALLEQMIRQERIRQGISEPTDG